MTAPIIAILIVLGILAIAQVIISRVVRGPFKVPPTQMDTTPVKGDSGRTATSNEEAETSVVAHQRTKRLAVLIAGPFLFLFLMTVAFQVVLARQNNGLISTIRDLREKYEGYRDKGILDEKFEQDLLSNHQFVLKTLNKIAAYRTVLLGPPALEASIEDVVVDGVDVVYVIGDSTTRVAETYALSRTGPVAVFRSVVVARTDAMSDSLPSDLKCFEKLRSGDGWTQVAVSRITAACVESSQVVSCQLSIELSPELDLYEPCKLMVTYSHCIGSLTQPPPSIAHFDPRPYKLISDLDLTISVNHPLQYALIPTFDPSYLQFNLFAALGPKRTFSALDDADGVLGSLHLLDIKRKSELRARYAYQLHVGDADSPVALLFKISDY